MRQNIDHIDIEVLELLAKRHELCVKVGEHKIEAGHPTRDLEREKEIILKKIALGKRLGLNPKFTHQLFDLVIEHSVRMQYQMKDEKHSQPEKNYRVGYLGDQGSYSHQAMLKHFSDKNASISSFGFKSFKEILKSVQDDVMDIGILPIENTTSGAILEVYDLLQGSGIYIIGEDILEIKHCLVGQADAAQETITTILGHPQAIAQCNELLIKNPDIKVEYCSSSANALEEVISRSNNQTVALANQFAAELYNLKVIEKNVSNAQQNFTRFILISKKEKKLASEIPAKVSIVFSTGQQAGALVSVLNCLKQNDIGLTKLQSRPIPDRPWEELFYADIDGHIEDPTISSALSSAEKHCKFLKILGCYANSALPKAFE
ncbi:bifunctional chorismate mutase/prephenate dehydratase [Pleionea sp. CnH1-48]|uniref:bifunctional chorismate mutase/prephenate dehydratase n=1 Tax=Pleionea sp. CnH1-48 TaxID=2954494 RepID=UPI00209793C9|nr:prephenate dehydratase domain-containing protein [Pleionea sp. CnH1-48]MCO7227141.1 chorismate mutase [Pleionea sp. CnH1-48]